MTEVASFEAKYAIFCPFVILVIANKQGIHDPEVPTY